MEKFEEQEDTLFQELRAIKEEFGFDSLDEAAAEVITWGESIDPDFIDYCESYLTRFDDNV